MAKNIVFCADGTWQSAESTAPSNVLKLFNALPGTLAVGQQATDPEQEKTDTDLVAKYVDGVGAGDNQLAKIVGGALGVGLIAHILRGYTFISRVYEPGDRIFLVGFSRGAYTARALAGFIVSQGLLDWKKLALSAGSADSYRYGAAAWYAYQQACQKKDPSPNFLSRMERILSDAPAFFEGLTKKPLYKKDITIVAVGVWDTVGSLGIPELSEDHGARLDLLRFANLDLDTKVFYGFHAIAADEQRIDFTPSLWNPRNNITQFFFPGSHADVGGGFPLGEESSLSDLALNWMVQCLSPLGLTFTQTIPTGNHLGPEHAPWHEMPYSVRPSGPREFPSSTGPNTPIAVSPGLKMRLRHPVDLVISSKPPLNRNVQYMSLALAYAGYVYPYTAPST